MTSVCASTPSQIDIESFRAKVLGEGAAHYRDLPWRHDFDPYKIWIAEVMLQQTQVSRVDGRWQRWLERFPTVDALAAASSADVLEEWQGLGYNRRALSALACAQEVSAEGGAFPTGVEELVALPGIGPATAAGIRAFAHNLHSVYLETNVRAVFLHELFPNEEGVSDKSLISLIDATCPEDSGDPHFEPGVTDDPRTWYFALLDYGAYLKKTVPNPSRRSASHVKQSRFEGSHRQKRAEVVRILLAAGGREPGMRVSEIEAALSDAEEKAGRDRVEREMVEAILAELAAEGFCSEHDGHWQV